MNKITKIISIGKNNTALITFLWYYAKISYLYAHAQKKERKKENEKKEKKNYSTLWLLWG